MHMWMNQWITLWRQTGPSVQQEARRKLQLSASWIAVVTPPAAGCHLRHFTELQWTNLSTVKGCISYSIGSQRAKDGQWREFMRQLAHYKGRIYNHISFIHKRNETVSAEEAKRISYVQSAISATNIGYRRGKRGFLPANLWYTHTLRQK